jgi:hypothetical protein
MNYACYYKYRTNNTITNLGFNNDRNQACFSDMYYEIRRDVHVKSITLKIKTTPDDLERNRNNYLILTDEEFKVWKRLVAKLCGVKITSVTKEKYIVVKIVTKDRPQRLMFASTMIRYAYEWPYTFFLKDAFRLKQVRGFKSLNILNLFDLVAFLYDGFQRTGHRIGSPLIIPLLPNAESTIKAIDYLSKLKNLYMSRLQGNDWSYNRAPIPDKVNRDYADLKRKINKYCFLNKEECFITGEDFTEWRLPLYRKYLNLYKKNIHYYIETALKENGNLDCYTKEDKWIKKYL